MFTLFKILIHFHILDNDEEEDDDQDIPQEIEEVIEELIQGLKNENSQTRFSIL